MKQKFRIWWNSLHFLPINRYLRWGSVFKKVCLILLRYDKTSIFCKPEASALSILLSWTKKHWTTYKYTQRRIKNAPHCRNGITNHFTDVGNRFKYSFKKTKMTGQHWMNYIVSVKKWTEGTIGQINETGHPIPFF